MIALYTQSDIHEIISTEISVMGEYLIVFHSGYYNRTR